MTGKILDLMKNGYIIVPKTLLQNYKNLKCFLFVFMV